MKTIEKKDDDLARYPIGARVTCGEYKEGEGCGTIYEIERREDWYNKTFPQHYNAYGPAFYNSPYANCPNCGLDNMIPSEGNQEARRG